MSFPPGFLEELRERVSLVETVAHKVRLARRGREHTGLCPFHKEKTPSFTVSDDKGFYHCFGCGAHGDAISFVMGTDGLSFPEAVEKLAAEVGMEVPRGSPEQAARQERTRDLHALLEAASAWFAQQLRLPEGKAALDYLRGRGIDDAAIARHRLGFAPDRRGALQGALSREGFTVEAAREAGLIKQSDDGRDYEYFRGRVIFPIADRRGRILGFGGRAMGDQQPKYLNSPETSAFHKGRVLYNHAHALAASRETGEVVVVEGYMDVIALDGAGIRHTVAPLGTALTEEQIAALWRMAPEPVLCFDGDAAGQRAAARAAERVMPILQPGLSLRFATLPPGEDPDSLIRAGGAQAVQPVLSAARPLSDVVWRLELDRQIPNTPERRAALRKRLMEAAGRVGDPVVRDFYVNEFRGRLSDLFSADSSGTGNRRFRPAGSGWGRGDRRSSDGRAGDRQPRPVQDLSASARAALLKIQRGRAQQALLATLINHPDTIADVAERVAVLRFPDSRLDVLRSAILNLAAAADVLDAPLFRAQLDRAGFGAAVDAILCPEVYGLAPGARAGTDGMRVRQGLMHLLDHLQGPVLLEEVGVRMSRIHDQVSDTELDSILGVVISEQAGGGAAGDE